MILKIQKNKQQNTAKIRFEYITNAEVTYLMLKSTLWNEVNPCMGRDWVGLKMCAVPSPPINIFCKRKFKDVQSSHRYCYLAALKGVWEETLQQFALR